MRNKIIAFCCENSSILSAENVEDSNPVNDAVEIVRLPCSGKVEIGLVLKCLENGSPGVLILACPKDGCKYISGNIRTEKRINELKKALCNAGIDDKKVHMDFLSSVDSPKFVDIVDKMMERLFPEEKK
jgi:coenzyme F420-reducing hydrogenase delta subunit